MSDLLVKNHRPDAEGLVHRVTPASAGWSYVGFDLYRLRPGQRLNLSTGTDEWCIVLISGRCDVAVEDGPSWSGIGERMDPFSASPASVYLPWQTRLHLAARTELEIGICKAPGGGGHPPRLIPPDQVRRLTRGQGSNTRHPRDILPEDQPAHSLLVVEVITPSGCWSSYPSHKHDQDNLPEESALEEVYYHRFNPEQGFGFQRIYTEDRSLDVAMSIEDGDLTLVPRGYHPCAAAHGYDLYYLNVMAGPKRIWKFNTEAAHRWLLS